MLILISASRKSSLHGYKNKTKNEVQNFEHWKFFRILFILLCLETLNTKISNKENKNNIKMVS